MPPPYLPAAQQRKKQAGALLLRQKILREATVLDLDILKVSSLLSHMTLTLTLTLPLTLPLPLPLTR